MSVINSEKQTVNKISEEIVSLTALKAALSVPGVNRLSETITDNISKKIAGKDNQAKGIKITIDDNLAYIDLFIMVDYGSKIPEIAWNVQSSVKEAVEAVTDFKVKKVNIHIQGVMLPRKKPQEGN